MVTAPVMGYGLLMTIQTPWGVGPWDVLHLGLARQLGITVGRANQLAAPPSSCSFCSCGDGPSPS